jgi:hypothetical protein
VFIEEKILREGLRHLFELFLIGGKCLDKKASGKSPTAFLIKRIRIFFETLIYAIWKAVAPEKLLEM